MGAEEVTEALPAVGDSPADEISALVDEPAAGSEVPPTVHMKAAPAPPPPGPPASAPVEATVLMKGPPPPPARPRGTPASAPAPARREEEEPATIVLASSETIRAKAPEVTVTASTPTPTPPQQGTNTVPAPSTATVPMPAGEGPAAAAPAVAAARKSGAAMLVVGGLAVVLLLGVALAGLAVVRRRTEIAAATPAPTLPPSTLAATAPPPPSTVAPAPVLGALHVETQPPGATISVDGQPRGVTPVDVSELALGHHEVKAELKGYMPVAQAVELGADTPRAELKLTLARAAAAMGVADILSTPLGATVKVDGAVVGRTPLVDFKLKPGPHHVEVARDGYEAWSQTVTAGPRKLWLDAALRPTRATPAPTPVAEAVDTNRVYAESEVDAPPKKLSGMSASYPVGRAPRLRTGDSVSVTVTYVVNDAGQVTDLKVSESGGRVLDDEVLSALREWKYAPGSKRGTKVKVRLLRKFTFKGG